MSSLNNNNQYENFTVKELKDMLRNKGLPLGGKKADLVQRVTNELGKYSSKKSSKKLVKKELVKKESVKKVTNKKKKVTFNMEKNTIVEKVKSTKKETCVTKMRKLPVYKRCLDKVEAQGNARYNKYALCTSSLKKKYCPND